MEVVSPDSSPASTAINAQGKKGNKIIFWTDFYWNGSLALVASIFTSSLFYKWWNKIDKMEVVSPDSSPESTAICYLPKNSIVSRTAINLQGKKGNKIIFWAVVLAYVLLALSAIFCYTETWTGFYWNGGLALMVSILPGSLFYKWWNKINKCEPPMETWV